MSEAKKFTREEFTAALERAVALKGEDYVYERPEDGFCKYMYDGQPSCLIGHALLDLGVEYSAQWEGKHARAIGHGVDHQDYVPTFNWPDDSTAHAAIRAQGRQDDGETWGVALDTYKAYLVASDALTAGA